VLAATGPGLGGLPGSPRVLLTLATPRRYDQPDYYRRVAGRIYGGQARRDPDALLHGSVARFVERPSTWGYLGQLFAISGWTSLPWLHRLRQPTLVLAGDDDPIVPLLNGGILARRIPNARLHVVDGGGHLFLLEQPARIAAAVAGYLEHAGEGGHVGRTTRGPGPTRASRRGRSGAGPAQEPLVVMATMSATLLRWAKRHRWW
jgi:poly(3-hydroxyoctanoate) depolymerase